MGGRLSLSLTARTGHYQRCQDRQAPYHIDEVVLAHHVAELLGADDIAAVTLLRIDPEVAIGFEVVTDRLHLFDDLGVRSVGDSVCIVDRLRNPPGVGSGMPQG